MKILANSLLHFEHVLTIKCGVISESVNKGKKKKKVVNEVFSENTQGYNTLGQILKRSFFFVEHEYSIIESEYIM
jgi:hypothetical protein